MNLSRSTGYSVLCVLGLLAHCTVHAQDNNGPTLEESVGYFPTHQESGTINSADYDYPRSLGGPLSGPDLDRWGATGGIWPNESENDGYGKVQRFLRPVDYILRPVTPGETLVVQGPTAESWLQLGGAFPFLTRTYHQEKSHVADLFGEEFAENSPLFFDVMAISFTAMYVDASGAGFDFSGLEEGFLGALSVSIRAGWALTDRTSIVVAGEVYFIFGDDYDVQFYVDAGALSALASFHLQEQVGSWDIHLFDDLIPFSARQLFFQETYQGENVQSSGHHYLGIPDRLDSGNWWNSRSHYLMNSAGLTAGTFIGQNWRFLAGIGRIDTWQWNDFDQHQGDEYVNAGLFYDGYGSWIAPSLTYQMHTQDFENEQQTIMLNAVAPISSNITANAGVGYDWGHFFEGWDWNAGIQYQQTDRLRHWLSYSSGFQDSTIGQDFLGTRWEFGTNYQLGPRISLGAYAGWFDSSEVGPNALHVGGSANFALGNYTSFRFLAGYLDTSNDDAIDRDGTDWLYSATLACRLAQRLNAELTYEYIDSGIGRYTEQMILLRVTRTF